MRKLIQVSVAAAFLCAGLWATAADAQSTSRTIIRDAEIENTIRAYAVPLFRSAGLDPASVKIHIIKDRNLNAFVAGGQQLFLHTGLLIRSTGADQIIGVIAHETGHIAAGHLSRTQDAIRLTRTQSILGALLGGATAIATGRPDVGAAIALGTSQVAIRGFLQYSRTQEAAADHAGLAFLDRTGQSARGLLYFLGLLEDQELLSRERQDPYLRTHPLSRERMQAIEAHVQRSPNSDTPVSPRFQSMHARMRAKLYGFMEPLGTVLNAYPTDDTSLEARYAQAIAYYRVGRLDEALSLIDGLFAVHPEDPFFHELRGQMLFESGRVAAALPSYETAVRLLPNSPILRFELARVQLETQDPDLIPAAVMHLKVAIHRDRRSANAWRQLGIAYGRQGKTGLSSVALAEEALLRGHVKQARYHAGKAEQILPRGSPGWLQTQDILEASKK